MVLIIPQGRWTSPPKYPRFVRECPLRYAQTRVISVINSVMQGSSDLYGKNFVVALYYNSNYKAMIVAVTFIHTPCRLISSSQPILSCTT